MAIRRETTGDIRVCDGCGRSDTGPNQELRIQTVTVHDPNVGAAVEHDLCGGCRANRGLAEPVAQIAGWERH
jgi:hypothetical protein